MEEKILNNQATLSFNLQRFAVELDNGVYKHNIGTDDDAKTITCYFTNITDFDKTATETDLISVSGDTITVGGVSVKLSAESDGSIYFNGTATKENGEMTSIEVTGIKINGISAEVNGVTYTADSTSSTITFDSEDKNKTSISNNVAISVRQTAKSFTIANGTTATINDVAFKSNVANGGVSFGKYSVSDVKLTGSFTIGDGKQYLNLNINDVTYSGTGKIDITNSAITLSGEVTAEYNLDDQVYKTDKTDTTLDATFEIAKKTSLKIDGITYATPKKDIGSIKVENETVTIIEGTITIGDNEQSLKAKEFLVNDEADATFMAKKDESFIINGITYKATSNNAEINVADGEVNLDGVFSVTLEKGEFIVLDGITCTADENSGITFTYDSDNGEFTFSGSLKLEGKKLTFIVNGVTYDSASKNNCSIEFTNSIITLAGDFAVGAEDESLSGKTFSTTSGESTFNLKSGDTGVKVNDATYTAGSTDTLTLKQQTGDVIQVDGSGAKIIGTGNFQVATNTPIEINKVKFEGTSENYNSSTINFTDESTVKLEDTFTVDVGSNVKNFTISDDSYVEGSTFNVKSDNSAVSIDGVTYSGNGTVEVESDVINLSGTSLTVGDSAKSESLNNKKFSTTGDCAASFNVAKSDQVTINDETYNASSDNSNVSIDKDGTTLQGSFNFDEDDEKERVFNITSTSDAVYGGVTYKGDGKVTIEGSSVT
ncbi:MAG: hypothetical protein IJS29_07515, partial [Selenomonadaceae bacterium]|nr:hypothetical protein [Selenomonadaceae bacterium]